MAYYAKSVYLLVISAKYDIEMMRSDIGKLMSAAQRWCKPCMHGKQLMGFAIVSEETATALRDRLHPTLSSLSGVGEYWVYPAPQADDIVSVAGAFSPMSHYVRAAWVEARKGSQPQHMRRAQRR